MRQWCSARRRTRKTIPGAHNIAGARWVGRRIAASSASRSAWQPFPASVVSACKTRCTGRHTGIGKRKITDALGVASPALAFLLNAAIWRHHIDRRSRNSSDPRCCKLNRGVVNVEIKNRFVLISVYFIVAVVHGVKLPSSSANVRSTRAKSFVWLWAARPPLAPELRTLSDIGFPDQVRDALAIRAAAENFGERAQLHCGIFRIRNRFVSALVAPCRHERRALRFQAATLTRLGSGKPLDSASIRSASS